MLVLDYFP